jgi:hypothetical protein
VLHGVDMGSRLAAENPRRPDDLLPAVLDLFLPRAHLPANAETPMSDIAADGLSGRAPIGDSGNDIARGS